MFKINLAITVPQSTTTDDSAGQCAHNCVVYRKIRIEVGFFVCSGRESFIHNDLDAKFTNTENYSSVWRCA